jgi:hypothetical protein
VDPTLLVDTALQSIILTNPSVALDAENKIVYLRAEQLAQVSVVSGGGSGHEPSFAAFVGRGLLTAAVTGTILASPDPEQVKVAIMKRVPGENGILAIVMNNPVKKFFVPFRIKLHILCCGVPLFTGLRRATSRASRSLSRKRKLQGLTLSLWSSAMM